MAHGKFEVETAETPERAVLVGIERPGASVPAGESLAELERLAHTAGAETVFTMTQRLDAPNPRTFIGRGKAEELTAEGLDNMVKACLAADNPNKHDGMPQAPEGCTHDCSSCGSSCSERTEPQSLLKPLNSASRVGKVIAVVSGKGGVGKSMVTSMMAVLMQRRGYKTAILDAEIGRAHV